MKTYKLLLTLLIVAFVISCKQEKNAKTDLAGTSTDTIQKPKAKPELQLVWETDTIFKTPESCFFDEEHKVIYVSNVNNAPRTKDNNGFISKLDLDGKVLEKEWVTELSAPKGMGFYHEILFVTDIDALVEINAHTGFTIKRTPLEGAKMLNDIDVDQETGIVYVSAMDTGKIYSYEDGKFALWKDNLNKPNGLFVDGNYLLIASAGDGNLKAFDIKTKEEKVLLAKDLGAADGVVKMPSGSYLVSDWRGEIHLLDGKGSATSLLNTITDKKAQTADIGSIPNENIILVPTFFGNSVKAFKLVE